MGIDETKHESGRRSGKDRRKIGDVNYKGQERRNGRERRSGMDRRKKVRIKK